MVSLSWDMTLLTIYRFLKSWSTIDQLVLTNLEPCHTHTHHKPCLLEPCLPRPVTEHSQPKLAKGSYLTEAVLSIASKHFPASTSNMYLPFMTSRVALILGQKNHQQPLPGLWDLTYWVPFPFHRLSSSLLHSMPSSVTSTNMSCTGHPISLLSFPCTAPVLLLSPKQTKAHRQQQWFGILNSAYLSFKNSEVRKPLLNR